MVKASTNEPPEDKKEATKRKISTKKKTVMTGVWPCKINGCNKQFAREADLKRHQRTTKLHSMPGFACPQCDATFTRTDALRRHQKSRHNGVVIEPIEQDAKDGPDDDAGSSESQSKSRSATPSSKGKEKATVSRPYQPPAYVTSAHSIPGGPSSYYRQHTATTSTGPYIPRPPIMDPQYAQIGLPTSATRLNLATNWGYPQPWSDGASSQPGTISYQPMPPVFYYPQYRPNGDMNQHPGQSPPQNNPKHQQVQSRTSDTRESPNLQDAQYNENQSGNRNGSSHPTNGDHSTIPSIDPELDSSDCATTLTQEQVLEITKAAMAVLEAENSTSASEARSASSAHSENEINVNNEENSADDNSVAQLPGSEAIDAIHGYGPALKRPEPMEHMLTEDGEPMLNPAELLTQESLASPPPS